jgi:hypothetical protein
MVEGGAALTEKSGTNLQTCSRPPAAASIPTAAGMPSEVGRKWYSTSGAINALRVAKSLAFIAPTKARTKAEPVVWWVVDMLTMRGGVGGNDKIVAYSPPTYMQSRAKSRFAA